MAKVLSGIFGGGDSKPAPIVLPPLPTREEATEKGTQAVDARRRRAGRARTIMTGTDLESTDPTLRRPTLGA